MAQIENLTIDQGADFHQVFKYYTDTANTIPMDLTGATANMVIRRTDFDGNKLLTLTSTSGLVINEGASTIRIDITAAQSAAITPTARGDSTIEGVYDLEVTVGGEIKRVQEGTVTINRNVTR